MLVVKGKIGETGADGKPDARPNAPGARFDSLLGQSPLSPRRPTPALLGSPPLPARPRGTITHEERGLQDLWNRKLPLIAERGAWAPNRDTSQIPLGTPFKVGVDRDRDVLGVDIEGTQPHGSRRWEFSRVEKTMIARRCFGPTTPTRATARAPRNRQGASQAGSCQTANDGSDKSGMGVPRSIETRNKTHACMALRRNETKKNTVLRIRMGRDQGRGRCLVALA